MSTYKAWDGNDYPAPPPEGWYQASDALWWPEGYGPGPAAAPAPAPEAPPAPAPGPESPSFEAPVAESPSFEAPVAGSPSFEAPVAESPSFDRDPTSVMPSYGGSAGAGGNIPSHTMAPPASHEPPPAGVPGPAPDPWAQPGGSGPVGPGAVDGASSEPAAMDWSQPPMSTPPTGYDSPSSGKSSNKGVLIGAGVLLLLVVAGGIGFALTRGGGDDAVVAFDPSAAKGSAANPHTAGDLVRISYEDPDTGAPTEWTIEIMSAPVDSSTDGGDDVDATVDLRVSLAAAGAPGALSSLSFGALGPDGGRTSTGRCAAPANPLPEDRLVSVGEVVEGSVCWQVPAADLTDLTMVVEVDGIDGQVYMDVQ